ncbi:MAG: hypothetical protein ACP5D2_02675 [Candidatus Nanoarchaeia archaeon]
MKKVKAPVRIDFAGGTTDISPFKDRYGGVVLNAAINRYISGKLISNKDKVALHYGGNIPTSSGLGTSGVMNLVWLALISKPDRLDEKRRKQLAENVYKLEQSQSWTGGKQDAYASAFGGINLWEFDKDKVKQRKLKLDKKAIKKLEKNLLLLYIGKHDAFDVNKSMISNLSKKTAILKKIKSIAYEQADALEAGKLDRFAELLDEETDTRRKLHKNVIPASVDKVIKLAREAGAEAVKVCGAGGGGSLLLYGEHINKSKLAKYNLINVKFDWEGLREC